MELYNLSKKQRDDLEIKVDKIFKRKVENKELDLIFRVEGDKKPFLNIPIDFVHNSISKDYFPQLHVDIVDGFYHLLQQDFPENVYLTCWFIQSYEQIKKVKNKVVIEIEDGTNNDFFERFFDSSNYKKKLLDRMLGSIHKKKGLIYFPIYIDLGHFALVVFDCKEQTLTYYDSYLKIGKKDKDGFSEYANKYIETVTNYIIDYYKTVTDIKLKTSKVLKKFVKDFAENGDVIQSDDMPQQANLTDCGVYCCLIGYILSNKEEIPEELNKEQIYSARLKIKESLLEGKITN